jgi:hypothetical protein
MKYKITDCKHRKKDSPEASELITSILDGPIIPFPPNISIEEDCLAHLFYDEILNPTVEFTVMPAKKTQTMTIPSSDVYVGSWQVKGFNIPAAGFLTSIDADTWLHKQNLEAGAVHRAAHKVAFNMDLLGFPRANAFQTPQPRT